MFYLKKKKLAYVPVPKNACSTVKTFLFKLQNNRDFKEFWAGTRRFQLHNVIPTLSYKEWKSNFFNFSGINKSDTFIFAIVRDPLLRFFSCYKNKVLQWNEIEHDELARNKCVTLNMPEKPDINTFVENFSFYQEICPSILHHTLPQVHFLGPDPNFYSKIYPIKKVDSELWDDLSKIVGEAIYAPQKRMQTGGSEMVIDPLTSENLVKIKDLYAADYDFLDEIIT